MSDYLQHKGYAGERGIQCRRRLPAREDPLHLILGHLRSPERGVEPEQPFKGSFNVRITPEAHRKAALMAAREGVSLNKLVERALLKEIA